MSETDVSAIEALYLGESGLDRSSMEPTPSFRFAVEIEGLEVGWFTECNGLTVERETHPYTEGGQNAYVHQLPKPLKQSRITLKRGLAGDVLWKWFAGEDDTGLSEGKVTYRNASIILYGLDRSEVRRWNLSRAYPVKWSGPDFKAEGNQVAIETLEIVHHGLTPGTTGG